MPLPPRDQRRWRCWVRGSNDHETVLFEGKTFYFAREKAAVHFAVAPHVIAGKLDETEQTNEEEKEPKAKAGGKARQETSKKLRWRQIGAKKRYEEKIQQQLQAKAKAQASTSVSRSKFTPASPGRYRTRDLRPFRMRRWCEPSVSSRRPFRYRAARAAPLS